MTHGGNRTDQELNLALEKAADMLGVSRANAVKAKSLLAKADPELVKLIPQPSLVVREL